MNKRLNVHLIMHPNCKLVAIDNSDYRSLGIDLINHVMLEFLSYKEDSHHLDNAVKIFIEKHNRDHYLFKNTSEFILEYDGTYSYYKLVVPLLCHFEVGDNQYHKLGGELFFHEQKLYKSNLPVNEETYDLNTVLKNSVIVYNYIDAYNIVQHGEASQTFYCPKEMIFSVCRLQKCLVFLQQKLLKKSCTNSCNEDEELRNQRDFLFSALYVFDYLKDTRNFIEAQRVLDNLSTCVSICNNINKHNCNCGNII